MDYAENLAKRIIESVIAGSTMRYHTNQSAGSHDFNLEYPDGTQAALEVTISTDQSSEATVAAISDVRKGGAFIKANLCRKDWWVHPAPNANINKIRAKVDEYLSAIEADGLDRFVGPVDSDTYLSVERIYTDHLIESGSVMKWKKPGQIGISYPGGGGFVVPENLQKAIEHEALKSDHRKKLGSAGTAERHLFVYVSSQNFLAWAALTDGDMPESAPELPDEITDVWAVTGAGQKDRYIVSRAGKGAEWQNLGVVEING